MCVLDRANAQNERLINAWCAVLNGGDEETGGLVIVRAASSTDKTSSQEPPPFQLPSRSRSLSVSSQAAGPPLKRLKSLTAVPSSSSRKPLSSSQSIRDEREAEEDVRQMESETDQLRRKSRASEDTVGFVNPPFPLQVASTSKRTTPGYTDTTQPVNAHETPKQDRNKSLREHGSVNGRRSSSGSRGKRISSSYETSGIIGALCFPPRSPNQICQIVRPQLNRTVLCRISPFTNISTLKYPNRNEHDNFSCGPHTEPRPHLHPVQYNLLNRGRIHRQNSTLKEPRYSDKSRNG